MILFRVRRRRMLMRASDRARDHGAWADSADYLRRALKLEPGSARIWIQYGHSLKEGGRPAEAEEAYLRATGLTPNDADAFLHLGHVRKRLDRIPDAIEAFAAALRLDPENHSARSELLGLGARDALPKDGPPDAIRAKQMASLATSFSAMSRAVSRWSAEAPASPSDYATFRSLYPVAPPPETGSGPVNVIILGNEALPAMARATLLSLLNQSVVDWTAQVVGPDLGDHSVASLGEIDHRIRFIDAAESHASGLVLWLEAGVVLDDQALAWMLFAARRTNAAAVYADDDAALPDWRAGPTRLAPRFFPMWDPVFFGGSDHVPAAVLTCGLTPLDATPARGENSRRLRRRLLLTAGEEGAVAHVPRTLFTEMMVPASITADQSVAFPSPQPTADAQPLRGDERITVIIATRDLPEMLEDCVLSLRRLAQSTDLLDILILDNRSTEPTTHSLLQRWQRDGTAKIIPFDEPFNWARANNIGAQAATGDILCLVNNDTIGLTERWDAHLASLLRDECVGIVGARLLYPDRTVQHAGVVMGIGRGSPIHEGVGAPETDSGPLGRWCVRRSVPAVTGAFLGIRRALFTELGGLDELRLPIGFNDIDLCLRARTHGQRVVYEPAIELLHYESKTRGHNNTLAKLVWDHGELEAFHARWGMATLNDPGYNPAWSRLGRPFDGFVEPSTRLILDHIDRSAARDPWLLSPTDLAPEN